MTNSLATKVVKKVSKAIKKKRHASLKEVEIENQKAYFRKSTKSGQPLVVRLHYWSSDYKQRDNLSYIAAEMDWNYIHPDFQGSNNKPDACGSEKVIADIDNAIDYAIKEGNADTSKIYVVGGSGGGHATLVTFMKSKHDINTFVAWVPITDLEAWYYESLGRKQKYANDILACTESFNGLNIEEAHRKSPLYMETPLDKLKKSKVKLFAGIHDGYTGPVPITHTLNFYNKLALDSNMPVIEQDEIIQLLGDRVGKEKIGTIQNREIHLQRSFGNVEIIVFEGGHDMLDKHTFDVLM